MKNTVIIEENAYPLDVSQAVNSVIVLLPIPR